MEIAKAYNPQEAQSKWLAFWDERGYFHSRPDSRQPFTIVIPPPNVTGALHMGHALNNTLQDVLIRWRRMQGYNALWMPGTDHAGIATQAVVERLIMQTEKKTRREIGREELVKRIWAWKDKYEARILGQLKQLGCSCDWARTRFTLDPVCVRAVRETFFKMFKDGLIFRGKRLVNWDAHLQTSVADDETYTEDTKGGFWTFKYPVKSAACGVAADAGSATPQAAEYICFSTTRPETMLGDTAVCVHPSDERYKHLIGKSVTIPLVNRDIPIIADALLADPELGTGCVKVTPAHDPNDYACYQRNPHIGIINILNPDGTINENGGKYQGLDRYKAREAVVADMEALGLFEGKEERVIPLKYSDRSKTPIEPYLSDQWFVKMGDLPAACGVAGTGDASAGINLGHATEADIKNAIAEHAGVKSINLTDLTISPAIIELIPEGLARENIIIPLALKERLLQIAMSDPADFDTVTKLQYMLKKDIQPVLAPKEQVIAAINRHYGPMETEWVECPHVTAKSTESAAPSPPAPLPRRGEGRIRLGFRLIKGFAEAHAATMIAARKEAPFRSVADLARRAHLSKALLARLAAADAFGSLGLDRRAALWKVLATGEDLPLFVGLDDDDADVPSLPAAAMHQHVVADYQTTGLSLKAHPIGLIRADLDRLNVISAKALLECQDKATVRIAGLVLVRQRPATASGTVFMSLEDETGLMNLIIWKRIWERFRKVAKHAVALYIEGKVERADRVIHVCPSKIDDLSHALQGLASRSRDFR